MKNRKNRNIIHKKYRRYRSDIWGTSAKKKRNNFITKFKKQEQKLEKLKNFVLQQIKDINTLIGETEMESSNLWDVVVFIQRLIDCLNFAITQAHANFYTTQINEVEKRYEEFSNNFLLSYKHKVLTEKIQQFLSYLKILFFVVASSTKEIEKEHLDGIISKFISELQNYKSQLQERIEILDRFTTKNLEKLEEYQEIVNLE